MLKKMVHLSYWVLLVVGFQDVLGQPTDTLGAKKELTVDVELRARTELRNGYRQLRLDTTTAAFYTGQRTRLNIGYRHPKYRLQLSAQDVRVWGDTDPRSTKGSIQLFEGYGDLLFGKGFFVRAGRQRVMYDNQRLFAQNDWRHNANAHDGVTVHYEGGKVNTELGAFFNQTGEQLFTTDFSPSGYSNYKLLVVHHLKAKLGKEATVTTIQAADGFQNATDKTEMRMRYTQGGRAEWEHGQWYATMSGYYQYGHTTSDKSIRAFYMQPEVKFSTLDKKLWVRLGAEWMSGDDAQNTDDATTYRSFVALYGVAHRFNGYMDFFTSFPTDLGNAGLINPYGFVQYQFSPKGFVRADCHWFYSHHPFVQDGQAMDTYLGFENDWIVNYALNEVTKLELGVSWASPTDALAAIKHSGNANLTPYWGYLMLTFKPEIFRSGKKG